jgi:hypothetical protein
MIGVAPIVSTVRPSLHLNVQLFPVAYEGQTVTPNDGMIQKNLTSQN